MFNATYLVSLADKDALAPIMEKLRAATGGVRALIAPTLPGVYNGGDLIVHLRLADEAQWKTIDAAIMAVQGDVAVAHVDSAAYEGGRNGTAEPDLRDGVYRTLLLSIDRPVKPQVIDQFEGEMGEMPYYIPAIRNWRLSRVKHARGSRRWTHVWEQEYRELGGLMGPYMMHPYHWGHIDRWFDPECADWMINTTICHSFCPLETSIISG